MTMTKSCALWNEHTRARRQQDKELDDTIRAEFPPGTRVRWTHTYDGKTREPVKREGVVSDFYGYGKVNVQIKQGGPKHCLYAYLLDIIEPAPGVMACTCGGYKAHANWCPASGVTEVPRG